MASLQGQPCLRCPTALGQEGLRGLAQERLCWTWCVGGQRISAAGMELSPITLPPLMVSLQLPSLLEQSHSCQHQS